MQKKQKKQKYIFILDVDGVMTTGQFLYSPDGKCYKIFGPHDSDGLKIIKDKIDIKFITADTRGYNISKKRIVDDLGFKLRLVSEQDRFEYIKKRYKFENLIYMGDGIHDAKIINASMFGIAPKNARIETKKVANYITPSNSAEGAVLDACLKINKLFFKNE